MTRALLLALALSCAPIGPPRPAPAPTGGARCAVAADIENGDLCPGSTADGFRCVRCPAWGGCVDPVYAVYCADFAAGCADPRCAP